MSVLPGSDRQAALASAGGSVSWVLCSCSGAGHSIGDSGTSPHPSYANQSVREGALDADLIET